MLLPYFADELVDPWTQRSPTIKPRSLGFGSRNQIARLHYKTGGLEFHGSTIRIRAFDRRRCFQAVQV